MLVGPLISLCPTSWQLKVCNVYEGMRSCADCHSGSGIPMQDYSDPDGYIPDDPALPGWNRQRRCDQNYLPRCGPCEGIGGPYWFECQSQTNGPC